MNTHVLTADERLQKELKDYYKDFIVTNNNQYIKYFIKQKDYSISVYTSGKVVFQGKEALKEFNKWQVTPLSYFEKEKSTNKESNVPYVDNNYIGSDEVGTGDVFGPICVCACYVDDNAKSIVKDLNIGDSKRLTDVYISKIAPILIEKLNYQVIVLNNKNYNTMISSGRNQVAIKAYLHNLAIAKLLNKTPKDTKVVIDQFVNSRVYFKYLLNEKEVVKDIHFETKAEDKYLAVALASIIARYAFIKEMEKISFQLDFEIPKGAGSLVDKALVKVIDLYGKDILKEVAKVHFNNIQKIL